MKVLIVDDHALLRDGLTALLQHFGPETRVLSAADGAALKGQVVFPADKEIPKRAELNVTQDKDHCLSKGKLLEESVVVNPQNRGVKNVVVFLRPDEEIGEEVQDEILDRVLRLDERQVQVHVRDGVVTLRGAVEFRSTARIAERLALGVDGVVAVRPLIDYAVDDTPAHAGAREDGPGHRHA